MSNGLNETTRDILRKPLTSHQRRGPGGNYSYHKGSDVIARLNDAFGHCWSSERVEVEVIEDQVLILVCLTVYIEGDAVVHHGYGSADIARGRNDNKIVNIGNSYKSAFTNALKKAAEQFGIGLGEEESVRESVRTAPTATSNYHQPQTQAQGFGPVPSPSSAPATTRFASAVAASNASSRPQMAKPEAMPTRSPGGTGGLRGTAAAAMLKVGPAPVAVPLDPSPPTPIPSAPPTNPAPMVKPEVRTDDLVSSVQEHALQRLAGMKNLSEEQLVVGALPLAGKTRFAELLRSEASEVIKYANVQPQGNA